jgi:hypothetical protein
MPSFAWARRFALFLLLITAGSAAAGGGSHRYYPGGVDRQDGMSVNIDLQLGSLLITSDQFDATACADQGQGLCFASDYMRFVPPPAAGAAQWRAHEADFAIVGTCTAKLAGARVQATRIVSEQNDLRFEFYFDPAGKRLLGWRVDYRDENGKPSHDLWMTNGMRRCKPVN